MKKGNNLLSSQAFGQTNQHFSSFTAGRVQPTCRFLTSFLEKRREATVRLGHQRLRTLMKRTSLWYLPGFAQAAKDFLFTVLSSRLWLKKDHEKCDKMLVNRQSMLLTLYGYPGCGSRREALRAHSLSSFPQPLGLKGRCHGHEAGKKKWVTEVTRNLSRLSISSSSCNLETLLQRKINFFIFL